MWMLSSAQGDMMGGNKRWEPGSPHVRACAHRSTHTTQMRADLSTFTYLIVRFLDDFDQNMTVAGLLSYDYSLQTFIYPVSPFSPTKPVKVNIKYIK